MGGGARLDFKFCSAGLGKDAGATASTDWIAFQVSTKVTLQVDASPAQAIDATPNKGTLPLHSDTSSDDSHSTPARRLEGLEITTPHVGTIN